MANCSRYYDVSLTCCQELVKTDCNDTFDSLKLCDQSDKSAAREILAQRCSLAASVSKCSCPTDKSGLEAGPIAGIVIGAVVFTSLLVLLTIWTVFIVKKRRRLSGKYSPSDNEGTNGRAAPLPIPPSYEGLM